MAGECLVIALIILVLSVGFFRAKRKNWGYAVLPLAVIPVVFGLTMYVMANLLKADYTFILPMIVTIVSLVASCIWIGIASAVLIKTKRMKVPYISVCVGFDLALSLVLLIRYYMMF